ncbi:hypothetical protein FGO68_gene591 [Halteria grandinella]|uniref:Uncharacterized protein n=1 Tax=Halteria grandinella TaxID=5974 RepID=A0A8J8TA53_HALGN|nr:hypothetical protein FGO68_gene591 [Halteria grandinella]
MSILQLLIAMKSPNNLDRFNPSRLKTSSLFLAFICFLFFHLATCQPQITCTDSEYKDDSTQTCMSKNKRHIQLIDRLQWSYIRMRKLLL